MKKTFMIVGADGGFSFSYSLAKKGHDVKLFEKSSTVACRS